MFVLAVVILSFLCLGKGFGFDFWRDDWGQLWSAIYKPELLTHEWAAIRLHPGSAMEQIWGAKIFGLNPFAWQVLGLMLRVLDSIMVALMVFAMTKSKKASVLSGLFFAALLPGLESFVWLSAHASALFIFFFCLGLYFWFELDEKGKGGVNFIASLVMLSLSIYVDPGRGISILFLIPLWSFLTIIRTRSKKIVTRIFVRTVLTLLPLILLLSHFNTGMVSYESLKQKWQLLYSQPGLIKVFLSSMGNLLIGWVRPISETGSLASITRTSCYAGAIFLFLGFFVSLLFLLRRTKFLQTLVFFIAWILVFYLPNWLFDQTLVVGTSHRYLTISSVGLVAIFALIISRLNRKYMFLAALFFILLNLRSSNIVLASQAKYRSSSVVEPLWQKINSDVPKGETNSIFMYEGGDYLRGVALDWSASVPFGIKRGVVNEDDFPIVTGDIDLIVKLLCEGNIERPSLGKWSFQKERVPLSHLHAWKLENGVLTDISKEKRIYFTKIATCKVSP